MKQILSMSSRGSLMNKALIDRVQLSHYHLQPNHTNWHVKDSHPFHSSVTSSSRSQTAPLKLSMKIVPVPVRVDNYAYLIIDEKSKSAAVVDPFDPRKVINAAKAENVSLSGTILTTHHHHDHSGGNEELISLLKNQTDSRANIQVYGGSDKIPGVIKPLSDGFKFKLHHVENDSSDRSEEKESSIQVTCLSTPCHTLDSFCFYVQDLNGGPGSVFTGDTLFNAGCGRFFEGNASQMNRALNETLGSLPDDTITYNGHEYTKSNIAFAKSIEPENAHVLQVFEFCTQNEPVITTGKYTIGDEKKFNPFMRLEEPAVLDAVGIPPRSDSAPPTTIVMQKLRDLKNGF